MAPAVYLLCMLMSTLCAFLLVRGYLRGRSPLLFWSALCFIGLAASNMFLVLDLVVFPDINFTPWRHPPALIGMSLLIYGLVWEVA